MDQGNENSIINVENNKEEIKNENNLKFLTNKFIKEQFKDEDTSYPNQILPDSNY